jgi:transcriptional regulator with XRE-family HTH domain
MKPKTIGQRLKQLRLEHNLSQKELAAKLFVQHTTISNWENDVRKINVEQLQIIARFFHVSLETFQPDRASTPTTINKHPKYIAIGVSVVAILVSTTTFILTNQSNRLTIDSCYGQADCTWINDPSIVSELNERNISGGLMTNVELDMVYSFLDAYVWKDYETLSTVNQKIFFEAYLYAFNQNSQFSQALTFSMMQYFLEPEMKKIHDYLNFESINLDNKQYLIQNGVKFVLYKTGQENFSYEIYDQVKRYIFTIDLIIQSLYLDSIRLLPDIEATIKQLLNTPNQGNHESTYTWSSYALFSATNRQYLAHGTKEKLNDQALNFQLHAYVPETDSLFRIEHYTGLIESSIGLVSGDDFAYYAYNNPINIEVSTLLDFIAAMDDGELQPRSEPEGNIPLSEMIPIILDAFESFPFETWDQTIASLGVSES